MQSPTRLMMTIVAALWLGAATAAMARESGDAARSARSGAAAAHRAPPAARSPRDARGWRFDGRHGHDRYYPSRGTVVRVLPDGYRHYAYAGRSYYSHGGIWYAPRGPRFVVVHPPVGLVVSVLPAFYTTLWFGGVPYYYADDVYYRWRPDLDGYSVVNAPDDADRQPATTVPDDLFIYPKNGQSQEQQSADRYECHAWARGQTGFDPTEPRGGVAASETASRRADYQRAMTACLEARGYSVR